MKSTPPALPVPGSRRVWRGVCLLVVLAVFAAFAFDLLRPTSAEKARPELSQAQLEMTENGLCLAGTEVRFNGFLVSHYADGALRSRSEIVEGRLHGLSEGWYQDGQIETREGFVHGVSHGIRLRWHPNGQKAVQADIRDGVFHGKFRRWHENGQLAQDISMQDGTPHGLSEAFFPSGSLQARVTMEKGNPVRKQFWEDGEIPAN